MIPLTNEEKKYIASIYVIYARKDLVMMIKKSKG